MIWNEGKLTNLFSNLFVQTKFLVPCTRYTRHTITESQEHGILIKLGTQCIINHVKMLLWDKDMRSYSYYVEVCQERALNIQY